jgi:hypothetical protein
LPAIALRYRWGEGDAGCYVTITYTHKDGTVEVSQLSSVVDGVEEETFSLPVGTSATFEPVFKRGSDTNEDHHEEPETGITVHFEPEADPESLKGYVAVVTTPGGSAAASVQPAEPGTSVFAASGTETAQPRTIGPAQSVTVMRVIYQERYPNEGFDGETSPNWVMAPQSAVTDIANALSQASSNLSVGFTIQPPSSSSQVTPATTSVSPQKLDILGFDPGDSSAVVPKIGDTLVSDAGLGISVKRHQEKTIAVHNVTQRDTGQGVPFAIAIEPGDGIHLLTTETGGDDSVTHGPNGVAVIDTGRNGLCETTAVKGDKVRIRPYNLPLSPQGYPDAVSVVDHCNRVIGLQTDTLFVLKSTKDEFCDYDLDRNGVLDVANAGVSPEEAEVKKLDDQAVDINIYFVKDFKLPGRPQAVGVTVFSTCICKDYTPGQLGSRVNLTAHEVGHALGIRYHSNEAGPFFVPGEAAQRRHLMYYAPAADATFLNKREWDAVNH